MAKTKMIHFSGLGYTYAVPAHVVADNYASYCAEERRDTSYEDHYEDIISDNEDIIDWFHNNMNPSDFEDHVSLVGGSPPSFVRVFFQEDILDAATDVVEVEVVS